MKVINTIRKDGILQGVITLGVFAAGFYFLFLRSHSAYAQQNQKNPEDIQDGKTVFYGSDGDPNNYVRGFEAPDSIDQLNLPKGYIYIITKPNTNIFSGLPAKSMVKVRREGNNLVYDGSVNGESGMYTENYQDIKNDIVLTNRASIKN